MSVSCPRSCLCERCARVLTCVDCIYFPWSEGEGCSEGGTVSCRYYERTDGNGTKADNHRANNG